MPSGGRPKTAAIGQGGGGRPAIHLDLTPRIVASLLPAATARARGVAVRSAEVPASHLIIQCETCGAVPRGRHRRYRQTSTGYLCRSCWNRSHEGEHEMGTVHGRRPKYTADDAARLRAAIASGQTHRQAAATTGIPSGSIAIVLDRYPETGPTKPAEDESLRTSLLAIIEAAGPSGIADSRTLPQTIRDRSGRYAGLHEVQHLIGSLIKQGLISAHQRTSGSNQKWYATVRSRSVAPERTGVDQPEIIEPVEPESPAEPTPPAASWPVLEALRARAADRATAETRAARYLEAAALLDGIDLGASSILEAKAAEAVADYSISRAEAEYLAYADAHEGDN